MNGVGYLRGLFTPSLLAYAVVGGVCALTEWLCFYLAISMHVQYVIAALIGFMVATALNYVLSSRYVFASRGRSVPEEVLLTYLVSGIAMGANLGLTIIIISMFATARRPPVMLVAKIVGTGAGFILNYLFRQYFVFNGQAVRVGAYFRRKAGI